MQDSNRNRPYAGNGQQDRGQQDRGQQNRGYGQNNPPENPKNWLSSNPIKQTWISDKADSDMIIFSDKAGRYVADNGLTSSKIRSIYGEIKRIQMGKYQEEAASFLLLRPKVAYALGREKSNKGLELFKLIFDEASKKVSDQKSFNNFCNLFEAILAYHKSYVKKDS